MKVYIITREFWSDEDDEYKSHFIAAVDTKESADNYVTYFHKNDHDIEITEYDISGFKIPEPFELKYI